MTINLKELKHLQNVGFGSICVLLGCSGSKTNDVLVRDLFVELGDVVEDKGVGFVYDENVCGFKFPRKIASLVKHLLLFGNRCYVVQETSISLHYTLVAIEHINLSREGSRSHQEKSQQLNYH
jgi:hypothetical protein